MKIKALPIIMLACLAGCDLLTPADSCEPGILHANLTPEQQASCAECGVAEGCDSETGETGGAEISCIGDHEDGLEEFCVVGSPLDGYWGDWVSKEISDCHTPTTPVPCIWSWDESEAERECMICEVLVSPSPTTIIHPTHTGEWPMCMTDDTLLGDYHKYRPAYAYTYANLTEPTSNWFDYTGCSFDSDTAAGSCNPVLMTTRSVSGGNDSFIGGLWTCECSVDSDCQTGAHCESGWIIDGGIPRPTLCTWDIGDGTSNGVAPEGPIVYGLDRWIDGITIDGDHVSMTPAMFTRLLTGVLNDDLEIGIDGSLLHVGSDSLAAHMGLRVGDALDVEQADLDALAAGESVELRVISGGYVRRTLVVNLVQ